MALASLSLVLLGLLCSVSGNDAGNDLPDDTAVNKIEYYGIPELERIQQTMDFYTAYLSGKGNEDEESLNETQGEPAEESSGGRARHLGGLNVGFGMGGIWPERGALLNSGGQMSIDPGRLQFGAGNMAGAVAMDASGGLAGGLGGLMNPGRQMSLDAGGLQFGDGNMAGAAVMDASGGLVAGGLLSPGGQMLDAEGQLTGGLSMGLNPGASADLGGVAVSGPTRFRGGGGFGGGYGGGFGGYGGFYGRPFYPPIAPPFFYGAVGPVVPIPIG